MTSLIRASHRAAFAGTKTKQKIGFRKALKTMTGHQEYPFGNALYMLIDSLNGEEPKVIGEKMKRRFLGQPRSSAV